MPVACFKGDGLSLFISHGCAVAVKINQRVMRCVTACIVKGIACSADLIENKHQMSIKMSYLSKLWSISCSQDFLCS